MEIIHVLVSHLFRNFIHFQRPVAEQFLGAFDSYAVQVRIESLAHFAGKDLSKIGTVIAEQRRDRFQFQIFPVIMVDVVKDIIDDRLAAWASDGVHADLKMLREILENLVQVILVFYEIDDRRIGTERDVHVAVGMGQVLLYLQVNIDEIMLDLRDIHGGVVKAGFQFLQSFRDAGPVLGLYVICQPAGIFHGFFIPAFSGQYGVVQRREIPVSQNMLIGLTEETPVQKPGNVLVGMADIFQKDQFRAQVQDFVQGFFAVGRLTAYGEAKSVPVDDIF